MKKDVLSRLNGYGWVDRQAGVAHIPIDRAIEIVGRSGLASAARGSGSNVSPEKMQDKKP
jgi:hypothetical protein